jgi:hypothetical protein
MVGTSRSTALTVILLSQIVGKESPDCIQLVDVSVDEVDNACLEEMQALPGYLRVSLM